MPIEQPPAEAVSRRGLLGGAAVIGAGAAIVAFGGSSASAAPASSTEVLGPVGSALSYMPLDALAFFAHNDASANSGRFFFDLTGTQPAVTPQRIAASLPLPSGSVIRQLNVAYQGQPIIEIHRRNLVDPALPPMPLQQTLLAGGGPKTQTLDLDPAIAVEAAATYSLQFYCSPGDSVYGVTVGYVSPMQSFVPFAGADPRVLDTRVTGGKLGPNDERTIALGFPGARGAVLNVTVTETQGAGFVAVHRAGIPWPGNSSLNWNQPGQILSNGVTTALDGVGAITIRGGVNPTHVVIDRIGWLV